MSHLPQRPRVPLRVQGIFFNSLPLIAVLLSAGFAYYSNQQRERTEMSLNRHFEMVENLAAIDRNLLSASAGVRGHLLTHDSSFLAPYAHARDLIPEKLARVRTLMESIPKENRRVEKLARFDVVQTQVKSEMEIARVAVDCRRTADRERHTAQGRRNQESDSSQSTDVRNNGPTIE